ncbi:cytochrome oxidase c subunit VIb domain-containing protein [Phthorimaea operculella]|nr:cytochrome oxidase c subunit VIb domain-containing protein [Phthorimaea operculella]
MVLRFGRHVKPSVQFAVYDYLDGGRHPTMSEAWYLENSNNRVYAIKNISDDNDADSVAQTKKISRIIIPSHRHCYQSYLDFHRCQKVRGEKYEACQYFKRVYKSMCPNEWVDKWDSQIEQGNFPGKI